MKRVMVLCSLMLMVSAASANFVVNPGFEDESGSPLLPDGWAQYTESGKTAYYAAKTDPVYDGIYSFKIAARDGYGMLHQTIGGFTGGQSLSFWLYGLGDTDSKGYWQMDEVGDKVDVFVKFIDAGGSKISEISMVLFDADESTDTPILSTSEWLKSPVFSFVTPENTAQVQIKIRSVDSTVNGDNDGTAVHLDNVTLVPEPATMVLLGLGSLLGLRRKR